MVFRNVDWRENQLDDKLVEKTVVLMAAMKVGWLVG